MFAYVQEFWKGKDAKIMAEVEKRWTKKNAKWLDNERRSPTHVSMAYCYDYNVGPEQLTSQLDWDFFSGEASEDMRP